MVAYHSLDESSLASTLDGRCCDVGRMTFITACDARRAAVYMTVIDARRLPTALPQHSVAPRQRPNDRRSKARRDLNRRRLTSLLDPVHC